MRWYKILIRTTKRLRGATGGLRKDIMKKTVCFTLILALILALAGDATYTLATKRVRKTEVPQEPRSLVDTDTITITAQPGLTVITDKTAGTVVQIGRRHR